MAHPGWVIRIAIYDIGIPFDHRIMVNDASGPFIGDSSPVQPLQLAASLDAVRLDRGRYVPIDRSEPGSACLALECIAPTFAGE